VTLTKAALDAIGDDIEKQVAALPPPEPADVAQLAAFLARVDIRLATQRARANGEAAP
jgi:hypothetical protein